MDNTQVPHKKPVPPQLIAAIAIIALIAVIALAFAVNTIWQNSQKANQALSEKLKAATSLVGKMQLQQQQILAQQKQALNQYEQGLEKALKTQQVHKSDWAIVNAVYLAKLAKYKLYYEHNISAAISVLQTAYNEISTLKGLDAITAQKAIESDIKALKDTTEVNREKIYLTLSKIDELLKSLPILAAPNTTKLYQKAEPGAKTWRDSLASSWETLKGIVSIRHHRQTSPALIGEKDSVILYQNLHELISQAQLAVLHRDNRIYHDNLSRAQKWIKTYFASNAAITQHTLKTLANLNTININPSYPDISDTLISLKQLEHNEVSQ